MIYRARSRVIFQQCSRFMLARIPSLCGAEIEPTELAHRTFFSPFDPRKSAQYIGAFFYFFHPGSFRKWHFRNELWKLGEGNYVESCEKYIARCFMALGREENSRGPNECLFTENARRLSLSLSPFSFSVWTWQRITRAFLRGARF